MPQRATHSPSCPNVDRCASCMPSRLPARQCVCSRSRHEADFVCPGLTPATSPTSF
jgi:hypothetical protein